MPEQTHQFSCVVSCCAMALRSFWVFLFLALLCAADAEPERRENDEFEWFNLLRSERSDPAGREERHEEEKGEEFFKPREPTLEFESEAGRIETWGSEFPALHRHGFEAARITVNPGGLALPMYLNSHAIKAVVQGSGIVGLVTERAGSFGQANQFRVNEGDVIAVPKGVLSWFFNDGEEPAQCVGMAYFGRDTDRFRKFQLLSGRAGFTPRVLSHAWNVSEETVRQLLDRQEKQDRIIKVSRESMRGERSMLNFGASDFIHQLGRDFPEAAARHGGVIREVNSGKMLALAALGMSARYLKLEGRAMYVPNYIHNGDKVIYVVKGNAELEVISDNGKRVVKQRFREGQLVFIPRGFPHVEVAGDEGYETFAAINTDRPMNSYFAGGNGVLNRIPRAILSSSFGLSRGDVEKLLSQREEDEAVIFPATQKQRQHEERDVM